MKSEFGVWGSVLRNWYLDLGCSGYGSSFGDGVLGIVQKKSIFRLLAFASFLMGNN